MSIFSAIKDAIFGHPAVAQTADPQAQANADFAISTAVDTAPAAT